MVGALLAFFAFGVAALAEEAMRVRNERFPRMKQTVPSSATSPVECQNLMGMDFRSQIFEAM